MRTSVRSISLISCALASVVACSSSDPASDGGSAGAAPTAGAGQAGSANPGGGAAGQPVGGGGGPVSTAGTTNGGATSAAAGGATSAGAGGVAIPMGGAGGVIVSAGSGGIDPGDTPPVRPLNVTVGGNKQIVHNFDGQSVGLDTRAKQIGKLVIDMGVNSGGYQPWLGKRGFHVYGISIYSGGGACNVNDWAKGRDDDGDCRLNSFDGKPHGTHTGTNSMAAHIKAGLASLQQQYPTEDWGYFLNADSSVRWSDVVFTGMSHGATTAAVVGKAVRLYRVVSRSGPRDNTCGNGAATGDFNRATPPWDPACPIAHIASWLDAPSATPMNRFYALIGTSDTEYGDLMFAMERMKYPGEPVRWDVDGNTLTGKNRFYSNEGHLDFLSAAKTPPHTNEALNEAFGVPAANQNPAF